MRKPYKGKEDSKLKFDKFSKDYKKATSYYTVSSSYKFSNDSSSSGSSELCCSLASASSQSLIKASISTISEARRRRRSSMILPMVLKADSEEMIEIGTVITSLAKMERTG
jgi:hypothetical protein